MPLESWLRLAPKLLDRSGNSRLEMKSVDALDWDPKAIPLARNMYAALFTAVAEKYG
jgi:hypothetical protein